MEEAAGRGLTAAAVNAVPVLPAAMPTATVGGWVISQAHFNCSPQVLPMVKREAAGGAGGGGAGAQLQGLTDYSGKHLGGTCL